MSESTNILWRFYDTSGKDSRYAEVFGPTGLNHSDRIILVGPNAKKDARLIAASPDLLEACKAMLNQFGANEQYAETDDDGDVQAIQQARAAIAKAESKWHLTIKGNR